MTAHPITPETIAQPGYIAARAILRADFITPEEIMQVRGVTYSPDQAERFAATLPGKEALEWCRADGCMIVAGPPEEMSLLAVRDLKRGYFYPQEGGWYEDEIETFSRDDKAGAVWIALKKNAVEGSLDKDWPEQETLVKAPMVLPNAAEVAWGVTTYKAVRGVSLLSNLYVWTTSVTSDGDRVGIGCFDSTGLGVNPFPDDYRGADLGVSAVRKF